MELGLFDWAAANELEKGNEHEKRVAYVLRDNIYSITLTCARLIKGPAWAASVAPLFKRHIHDEPIDDYLRGLQP
jgi:hypothetical protein